MHREKSTPDYFLFIIYWLWSDYFNWNQIVFIVFNWLIQEESEEHFSVQISNISRLYPRLFCINIMVIHGCRNGYRVLAYTNDTLKRVIGIPVNWHISTGILTRITCATFVKIPVEMCQFTRIPMTRFKVSFVLQNFSRCLFALRLE